MKAALKNYFSIICNREAYCWAAVGFMPELVPAQNVTGIQWHMFRYPVVIIITL